MPYERDSACVRAIAVQACGTWQGNIIINGYPEASEFHILNCGHYTIRWRNFAVAIHFDQNAPEPRLPNSSTGISSGRDFFHVSVPRSSAYQSLGRGRAYYFRCSDSEQVIL